MTTRTSICKHCRQPIEPDSPLLAWHVHPKRLRQRWVHADGFPYCDGQGEVPRYRAEPIEEEDGMTAQERLGKMAHDVQRIAMAIDGDRFDTALKDTVELLGDGLALHDELVELLGDADIKADA